MNNTLKSNIILDVGLSSWIIQDGNYPDFILGQQASFALEFVPQKGVQLLQGDYQISCKPIRNELYQVTAKVVNVSNEAWVIDFGVRAYMDSFTSFSPKVGDFLIGEVEIGIDPFMYFESLCKDNAVPELIYRWQIISIRRETAPFVEATDEQRRKLNFVGSNKLKVRDETKLKMMEVPRTNAWDDDDGHAEYLLTSELIDPLPRRSLVDA